jgi:hypothetical protein
MKTIALSVRYGMPDALIAAGPQKVIDDLAAYKRLGLGHVTIDFRRDDLGKMLELLDLVTGTVRPAVDRA